MSQITATISKTTKDALDKFTNERGLKKNHVVDQALLFYIQSRQSLPEEAFIPQRIELNTDGLNDLIRHIDDAPTDALVELMRDDH